LHTKNLDETRRHARDLAPAVRDLLAAESWQPRQIDAVAVSRGPGSYTGLRVGIISAKVFAYATGKPLIAVNTFDIIAAQAPDDVVDIDVLADAQQAKIYVQRYTRAGQRPLEPTTPLTIQPIAQWLAERPKDRWATGPGLRVSEMSALDRIVDTNWWDPNPESFVQVAAARYRQSRFDDAWTVEPLYLRASAAEEQWQARSPS
jgi:tRNA threonylcarbamoyladenosine biosynthesis protein TsaB